MERDRRAQWIDCSFGTTNLQRRVECADGGTSDSTCSARTLRNTWKTITQPRTKKEEIGSDSFV